jgi:hypothetical protein
MKIFLAALTATWLCLAVPAADAIKPGALWPDNLGEHIQAHGGGILKVGDTYYWFGEDRAKNNPRGLRCVSCMPRRTS